MANLSLYHITNGFAQLMENEEISEEEKAIIKDELSVLLKEKSENIIGFTKNLEFTIDAIKAEERRLADNRKDLEKRLSKFKDYVKECMENSNILKVETCLGKISIAKNPMSVEVINEALVPEEYKQVEIKTKIDRKAILDNFKETGELIEGVIVNTDKTSLRIK